MVVLHHQVPGADKQRDRPVDDLKRCQNAERLDLPAARGDHRERVAAPARRAAVLAAPVAAGRLAVLDEDFGDDRVGEDFGDDFGDDFAEDRDDDPAEDRDEEPAAEEVDAADAGGPDDLSTCPSRARLFSSWTTSAVPPTVNSTGHSIRPAAPTAANVSAAAVDEWLPSLIPLRIPAPTPLTPPITPLIAAPPIAPAVAVAASAVRLTIWVTPETMFISVSSR